MAYTIDRMISGASLDSVQTRVREALANNGFGVLTEIDVAATMRNKLGLELSGYLILGACNPQMAYKAIEVEPQVGAMLPCNVIVRETEHGVQVSAVDPVASMQAIDNTELQSLAHQVRDLLGKAIEQV